jgi:23S rRNA (uridine2552-2'-O)-methyltransferase
MKRTNRKKNPWADHYTRQAQKDNFAARSVYKLQEIQKKHRILSRGAGFWIWVVRRDHGCSSPPETAGPGGRLVGIDLTPVTIGLPDNVTVITGDVADLERHLAELGQTRFDVVLSDMAPATSGNRHVDEARSMGLCEAALDIADNYPGSRRQLRLQNFPGKRFQGLYRCRETALYTGRCHSGPKAHAKPAGRCLSSGWEKR